MRTHSPRSSSTPSRCTERRNGDGSAIIFVLDSQRPTQHQYPILSPAPIHTMVVHCCKRPVCCSSSYRTSDPVTYADAAALAAATAFCVPWAANLALRRNCKRVGGEWNGTSVGGTEEHMSATVQYSLSRCTHLGVNTLERLVTLGLDAGDTVAVRCKSAWPPILCSLILSPPHQHSHNRSRRLAQCWRADSFPSIAQP